MADDRSSSRVSPVRAALVIPLCLIVSGCGGLLKQGPVAKAYFTIDPGQPDAHAATLATARPDPVVLRVRTIRVSPPYDGTLFVYRIGPAQFDTDYYNNFIAAPASILTGGLIQWLARAGPMTVSDASSDLRADAILEGNITALYIDSTANPPKAVIAGLFFLTRDRDGAVELLSDKSYEAAVPVPARTPAGFAAGWGQAYRQLLGELTADVRPLCRGPEKPASGR